MDVSNLQKHYPLLLEYLCDNGYSRCQIQWMRRCIKLALNGGSSPEIDSYEQLYWREVQQRGYNDTAPVRRTLKSVLGCVKRFDLDGIYPQPNLCHGFLAPARSYDLLNDEYKSIIDHYERTARSGGKVAQTIYTEHRAGTLFFCIYKMQVHNQFQTFQKGRFLTFSLTERKSSEAKRIKTRLLRS